MVVLPSTRKDRGAPLVGASRLVLGGALLLVVALWCGLLFHIRNDQSRTRDDALHDTAALAKLVEEHTLAAIRQVDEFSARIKSQHERFGAGFEWFEMVIGKRAADAPFFRAFTIFDRDGHVVVTSKDSSDPAAEVVGRESFRVHLGRDVGLHIGVSFLDRQSGQLVIPFTRRLDGADGSFAGIVQVELETRYFTGFYAGAGLPSNSAVIITRSDGPILVRHPLNEMVAGRSVTTSAVWPALRQRENGNYEGPSAVDGVERVYAYRNNPDYPIFVVVGFPRETVFAAWRARSRDAIVALGVITLAIAVATCFLLGQLRRRLDSEAKHRAIFDSAVDGIVTTNAAGIVCSINPAAEAMFGYSGKELAGRHVSALFDADDAGSAWSGAARERRAGAETLARRRDGSELPVEIAVASWRTDQQVFFTGIVRDIADRKRIEAELMRARDDAEAASRAKSAFLANMSHELRTPLNAVIGFSDIICTQMLGPLGSPRYGEYARDIRSSGQHLLQLINDILDLSKAEAGHLVLHDEPVDLSATIKASCRMVETLAADRSIALEIDVAPGAGSVRGDDTRLRQIVLNLVSNAVKFTPDGGRVRVAVRHEADAIVLRVSDTGIGIAREDLDRVMEPFVQVESVLSRANSGTGLGLPLTKRLVELHGGTLEIASEPGTGTTATVRLPAERALRRVA